MTTLARTFLQKPRLSQDFSSCGATMRIIKRKYLAGLFCRCPFPARVRLLKGRQGQGCPLQQGHGLCGAEKGERGDHRVRNAIQIDPKFANARYQLGLLYRCCR